MLRDFGRRRGVLGRFQQATPRGLLELLLHGDRQRSAVVKEPKARGSVRAVKALYGEPQLHRLQAMKES